MTPDIRLVAVDIDGTFMRTDYTYDVPRFERLLARMLEAGCDFVVASGNQYYQLRDHFPGHEDELCFVAENGAYVMDRGELVYLRTMPDETVSTVIDVCRARADEVWNVLCGVEGAYCERGAVSDDFFNEMRRYCHRLSW
ncbi:MAG TPA: HAD hydrolase family protein, partial [Candidatus Olsenella excrementavium]|nr:HAD hydrolase family protein [Candidatus Olsenella excrementavium]